MNEEALAARVERLEQELNELRTDLRSLIASWDDHLEACPGAA